MGLWKAQITLYIPAVTSREADDVVRQAETFVKGLPQSASFAISWPKLIADMPPEPEKPVEPEPKKES